MFTRRLILGAAMATFALTAAPGAKAADAPKDVVASFSILGDIVKNVGGDRIKVTTLVGPNGDAHVYQPTPKDARAVAGADLVVVNGLGFEGWLDRLVGAAGYKGEIAVASAGLEALPNAEEEDEHDHEHADEHDKDHDEDHADKDGHEKHADADHDEHEEHHHHHHGKFDPHAWQSVSNVRVYVRNIRAALSKMDPAGAPSYDANAKAYLAKLDKLDGEIRAAVKGLPEGRRKVVTSHDAFGYFAHDYGIAFLAPVGMSTESEASAKEIAALIRQIREEEIPAVFVENITDRRLLDQITRETGAVIGGTLYSDALSEPEGPAGTYLKMMRHNYRTLAAALSAS